MKDDSYFDFMNMLNSVFRLLSFKLRREELLRLDRRYFILGLIGTWIVGMGRYWDDPKANILQHLGLGSIIYIFILAALIYLVVLPFKVKNWNYFLVLTFIALTSFPAIFYAIPVERFLSISMANKINVWFLIIVAAWRLGLLYYFIKEYTRLSKAEILTITLMPICLIISTLTALNLHRVVFNVMGGMRNTTPHDSAYFVLVVLTTISIILIGPLLITYLIFVSKRLKRAS